MRQTCAASVQEVKPVVNRCMMGLTTSVLRPLTLDTGAACPPAAELTRLLVSQHASLHWRAIALSHMWVNLMTPLNSEPALAGQVVRLLLRDMLASEMLLISVRLCCSGCCWQRVHVLGVRKLPAACAFGLAYNCPAAAWQSSPWANMRSQQSPSQTAHIP